MVVFMKEIGKKTKNDMDLEHINGKMVRYIVVIGKIMWLVVMENLLIKMETNMKEIGKTTKLMVMVNIDKKMELFIKETGKMINNMEKDLKFGEIQHNMKVIMLMERNKAGEYLNLMMVVFMKDSFIIII